MWWLAFYIFGFFVTAAFLIFVARQSASINKASPKTAANIIAFAIFWWAFWPVAIVSVLIDDEGD